ncbi:16S rRNA (guanine(527)-N(7))-methyltransferase RsmG [Actinophytocola oryzae]|uniref:16S rRNA (guanine(527)-N(7))-methyltransferase RsmG n=1 Tax=Actinophytocola oryzae TaxID=502181 RepID=UPI001063C422|nr:16S rRNA (guanine(527)-N(7))-methyltransferase RsmG [Actinophytocola oryzae]
MKHPPQIATTVFGDNLTAAVRFTELLAAVGVERGLIGPREVDRLWDRHILNSAVIASALPEGARVVDLGSGAGLPGVPLIIARPDLEVTLLEPMARRVAWLTEVVDTLSLSASVVRGRAEEPAIKRQLAGADVVIARAVAPLARLWAWSAPLLREGGRLVALKGESADEEVERDGSAVARAGGSQPVVEQRGADLLAVPTTIVVVTRLEPKRPERHDRGRNPRRAGKHAQRP